MRKPFIYEVKIGWQADPFGLKAITWLREQKIQVFRDYEIDMHGGQADHTSFWFKDRDKALIVKLTLGGL